MSVTEIADLVVQRMGLQNVRYEYQGGSRGWPGDVPIVRFDCSKIRRLGWKNRRTSFEALKDSIDSMIVDARAGKFKQNMNQNVSGTKS
jgi:UDP-glucose 4-epimerase